MFNRLENSQLQNIHYKVARRMVPPIEQMLVRLRAGNLGKLVQELGPIGLLKFLIEKEKITINTNWSDGGTRDSIAEEIKSKPTVLIVNHPFNIEPLIALEVLNSDHQMLGLFANFWLGLSFGSDIAKYLLPVYQVKGKEEAQIWKNIGRILHPHAPNLGIEAMRKARFILGHNGLVCIAPQGGSGDSGAWEKGVGNLVYYLDKLERDGRIIFAHVKGTSEANLIKMILFRPLPAGLSYKMPPVSISFSRVFRTKDIIKMIPHEYQSPKSKADLLTAIMENAYNNWTNSFGVNANFSSLTASIMQAGNRP